MTPKEKKKNNNKNNNNNNITFIKRIMQEPLSAYRNLKVERKDTNHKTRTNNTMEEIQHHKYEHSNK